MTREELAVAEALCRCTQSYGGHAKTCPTITTTPVLPAALAAHDRRILRDTEPFCRRCGTALTDNYVVVAGIFYCLLNCQPTESTT